MPLSIHPVMPGLVPGIHVFAEARQDVDGRDEPGHDAPYPATVAALTAA
jgi:hypothetical protein